METIPPVSQKSTFVDSIAWPAIGLAGLATFVFLLIAIVITLDPARADMISDPLLDHFGTPAIFLYLPYRLYVYFTLLVSLTTLISSIGLLKRRNWARLVFISMMCVGIVFDVFAFFQLFSLPFPFPLIHKLLQGMFLVGFALVFGWIVKRLSSKQVRAEFMPALVE